VTGIFIFARFGYRNTFPRAGNRMENPGRCRKTPLQKTQNPPAKNTVLSAKAGEKAEFHNFV
jgi:hypothetical protein